MQNKNTLIIIVIAAVIIVGGFFFLMGSGTDTSQNTSINTTNTASDQTQTTTQQPMTSDTVGTDTTGGTSAGKETTAPESTGSSAGSAQAGVVEIKVKGFMYGYDPKEIRVKKGDVVKIDFTSTDGFHDWVVDEFNAKTSRVNTGGSTSVTFTADKVGTFEYYCSVGQHRAMGMVGKLIVE